MLGSIRVEIEKEILQENIIYIIDKILLKFSFINKIIFTNKFY